MPIPDPSSSEIRIKTLSRGNLTTGNGRWQNLFPNQEPVWGCCRFLFDPFERRYDWLLVIDDLPQTRPQEANDLSALTRVDCPAEQTILVTTEPATITQYGTHFVRQFGHLLTSQTATELPHPQAVRSQTGNVWFYGKTYDEVKAMPPCPKARLLSTVCSSKQQGHTFHAQRYAFTQRLARECPEMDMFGHGIRFIKNKFEAIDPYAFHLAIENHLAPHHWTEKLADPLLGYAVPIYFGCPNVFDYFPEASVIPIDIRDFDGAVRVIREALTFENYQRRLPAVQEARRRLMNDYHLPALINRIVTQAGPLKKSDAPRPVGRLLSRRAMRRKHPADVFQFIRWRLQNYFQGLRVNGGKRE